MKLGLLIAIEIAYEFKQKMRISKYIPVPKEIKILTGHPE